MRRNDYNTGLRGGLFEQRHYVRMGSAIWLYAWLVLRQTHQQGATGWVLGGAPISYREIEEETGFNPRTLERWMRTLRTHGYVETEAVPAGIVVRITKAKKSTQYPQGIRRPAEGIRKCAEPRPQSRVANRQEAISNEQVTRRIGSSSVEGWIERKRETHRDFHNPQQILDPEPKSPPNPFPFEGNQTAQHNSSQRSQDCEQLKFILEARRRLQLLKAERDEEMRRELAVGASPEVRRS
jgi:hypothetical protein